MGNGSAGEYHENRYEYDILGRMTEKTDGEGQSECYEYDNTGKIIKKVDRNGKIWYYEYDGMGRMVSEKGEKDSEGNRYEYDIRSNKIKVRDITGKLEEEYGYNGYGELISEKRGDSETAYEYAPDGELVKLTLYEGGAETFSEYYGYDERARLIYANTPAGSEYYTYDRSDRLISAVNDKAGSEYRYEYGEDGNIAGIYYSVKGVWEGEIQYEYDRAGRRIGEVSINGRRGIKEKKYSYDGAGRLIREKDGGEVTEYTYDAYGNTDGIYRYGEGVELDRRVYTYDKNNRVETAYEGGVYTAYEYDGNGNLISRTRAGERESYEYDGRNRMISARVGMNTAEYEYNSAGIRVAKTVNGERTEYALSGNNVIAEENAQNRNEYYRGKGLIGYSDGKGTYVYRKNGHGDISGVYDMYGILVQEYEYDAYGNEAADYGMYRYGGYAEAVVKESDTNPYRYAGEYYDIETGFIYLRARYYDPSDCRFVSEDPICDGVNWYVYCAGDPVNFIDPNGTDAIFLNYEEEAKGFGHTSLLLQDDDDVWYYYYWGGNDRDMSKNSVPWGSSPFCEMQELSQSQYNMRDMSEIIQFLNESYEKVNSNNNIERTLTLSDCLYLEGDFNKSVEAAKKMKEKADKYYDEAYKPFNKLFRYNLYVENCVQTCLDILSEGTFDKYDLAYKRTLSEARSLVIPNIAFSILKTEHKILNSPLKYLDFLNVIPETKLSTRIGAVIGIGILYENFSQKSD